MLGASRWFALSALLSGVVAAAEVRAAPLESLPISRLRLYEVGVGYIERTGRVQKGSSVDVPVLAGHIDDALKTLVVLTPGGQASVTSIEFPNRVSRGMARAMVGLPADGGAPGFGRLLESMKGMPVSLSTARGAVSGRLVEVSEDTERTRPCPGKDDESEPRCVERIEGRVAILTERGELVQFTRSELRSVRALDKAKQARLQSALDVLLARGVAEQENLVVRAESSAPLTLGYVAESPQWRATYRLVLGSSDGRLQGWALVHNDSDEDWRGVHVEIANGQPESFLFPLAAPRYVHRRMEAVEDGSTTAPQLLGATVDDLWDYEVGDHYGSGGLGLSGVGEGGGGRGDGIGLGSVGSMGHGSGTSPQSSLLDVGNLASTAQAVGAEAGALFTYVLAKPVDLRARSSALLPFLDTAVAVQRIAWIPRVGAPAESAVHVVNSSSQTLPAGVTSIFADGGFAGEVMLRRLKPNESQIARYGLDLDLELDVTALSQSEEPRRLIYLGSQLEEHFVRRQQLSYEAKNRSGSPRRVMVGLDAVNNARISGASSGYDALGHRPWAAFDVAAHHEQTTRITIDEGLKRLHDERTLTSAMLKKLSAAATLPAAQRGMLEQAASARVAVERLEQELKSAQVFLTRATRERQGYRDDLKALGDRDDDAEAIVKRLGEAESRRKNLERQIDVLTARLGSARARVKTLLAGLR